MALMQCLKPKNRFSVSQPKFPRPKLSNTDDMSAQDFHPGTHSTNIAISGATEVTRKCRAALLLSAVIAHSDTQPSLSLPLLPLLPVIKEQSLFFSASRVLSCSLLAEDGQKILLG